MVLVTLRQALGDLRVILSLSKYDLYVMLSQSINQATSYFTSSSNTTATLPHFPLAIKE